jgi:ABC-type Na+ efflux pump permease subunit
MRNIYHIARYDLLLTICDSSAWLWMFLFPVVFATFFGLVIGGSRSQPSDAKAVLTVINEDQGNLSKVFLSELKGERLVIKEISMAEKETTSDKVRTLLIPADFTERIIAGEKTTLRLEKDPGSNMEAALMAQARIIKAISRLIGGLVELTGGGEGKDEAELNSLTELPEEEDLIQVESSFAGKAKITPGGFAQSIPGNVVMFVMLVALTYGSASLTYERAGGLLRRMISMPVSRAEIIFAKIIGRFLIAVVQIAMLVLVGLLANKLFGIYIGENVFALFVVLLIYALVVAPLGVLFGAFFKDADHAANIGVVATISMAALGGCWWPQEILSEPLKIVALVFPTGWAMKALHEVVSFGHGLGDITPLLLILLGYAGVFTLIASRSLRVE